MSSGGNGAPATRTAALRHDLSKFVASCSQDATSGPFREPVATAHPDLAELYRATVRNPMDLRTMAHKVMAGAYQSPTAASAGRAAASVPDSSSVKRGGGATVPLTTTDVAWRNVWDDLELIHSNCLLFNGSTNPEWTPIADRFLSAAHQHLVQAFPDSVRFIPAPKPTPLHSMPSQATTMAADALDDHPRSGTSTPTSRYTPRRLPRDSASVASSLMAASTRTLVAGTETPTLAGRGGSVSASSTPTKVAVGTKRPRQPPPSVTPVPNVPKTSDAARPTTAPRGSTTREEKAVAPRGPPPSSTLSVVVKQEEGSAGVGALLASRRTLDAAAAAVASLAAKTEPLMDTPPHPRKFNLRSGCAASRAPRRPPAPSSAAVFVGAGGDASSAMPPSEAPPIVPPPRPALRIPPRLRVLVTEEHMQRHGTAREAGGDHKGAESPMCPVVAAPDARVASSHLSAMRVLQDFLKHVQELDGAANGAGARVPTPSALSTRPSLPTRHTDETAASSIKRIADDGGNEGSVLAGHARADLCRRIVDRVVVPGFASSAFACMLYPDERVAALAALARWQRERDDKKGEERAAASGSGADGDDALLVDNAAVTGPLFASAAWLHLLHVKVLCRWLIALPQLGAAVLQTQSDGALPPGPRDRVITELLLVPFVEAALAFIDRRLHPLKTVT